MSSALGTTYDDILVRDNFADIGNAPSTGVICQSPDIIPYGDDLMSFDLLESTYADGPDLGKPVKSGTNNNFYIRAKNLKDSATGGRVRLYAAPASLFCTPDQWRILHASGHLAWVPLVNRQGQEQIQPGQIACNQAAFSWGGDQQGTHYCSIVMVDTPDHHTSTPPIFPSNAAFSNWVAESPFVAWRNLIMIPPHQHFHSQNLVIQNLDADEKEFSFLVKGHGIPEGANNSIVIENTDPTARFHLSTDVPTPDKNTGLQKTALGPATLPGRYKGTAELNITTDQPLDYDMAATVLMYVYSDAPEAEGYRPEFGVDAAELGGQLIGSLHHVGDCSFTTGRQDGTVKIS